jgi:hypothetical protein
MANHLKKYYIQFADDLDLALIPVKQLSAIGTWSRRSSLIYQGTSSCTAKEIEDYITGTCGIRPARFRVIRDEDAIYLQR